MRLLKLNYMARFIKIIFLMLIVALSVVGCKKEEKEDVEGNRTSLVGKWGAEFEDVEVGEYTWILEFFKNGRGVSLYIEKDGKETYSFSWTADDDFLTIEWEDDDGGSVFRYQIKGNKLILTDLIDGETTVLYRK